MIPDQGSPAEGGHRAGGGCHVLGSANGAGLVRHESAYAKLAGAGGPAWPSPSGRLHAWLVDVGTASAVLRHHHTAFGRACSRPDRLDGAWPYARGCGCADDRGPLRACFPAVHHHPTAADASSPPSRSTRYPFITTS